MAAAAPFAELNALFARHCDAQRVRPSLAFIAALAVKTGGNFHETAIKCFTKGCWPR